MLLLRLLTVVAVAHLAFGSTGQGIKESHTELPKEEVAESVKQEVFLKTANTEPIEIDRLRKFETKGINSARGNDGYHTLNRAKELDEGTPIGRGAGTVAGTGGIGTGVAAGGYDPGVGHGVRVGGKNPAIGSGVVDDVEEVGTGIGSGVQTRRYDNVNSDSDEIGAIGSGIARDGDTLGSRVTLDSDNNGGVNTELGDRVTIGGGVRSRSRRFQDRFDSGYAKECNSYYGKIICYRVYTNPNIHTPEDYTCWRVSNNRKNCTEIDNIVYLKNRGFEPDEYETPRSQQHPTPRPRNSDTLQGRNTYYDPYAALNSNNNNNKPQGSSHRFVTSTLKLGRDNSLEDDNDADLYRVKRAPQSKINKPYTIPDYNNWNDYEENIHLHAKPVSKPRIPQSM